MLFKNFKDYEEFRRLYVREDGKRKNAILLAFTTSKNLFEWYRKRDMLDQFFGIKDMNELFKELVHMTSATSYGGYRIPLVDNIELNSNQYYADAQKGLCFDGDAASYRYIKNGKPYKMKIGRFIGALLEESRYGRIMPRPCKLWLCEELGERWKSYASSMVSEYSLVVDDDFESIYSTYCYRGNKGMGSCMENDGYHTFYNDAVDACAASLRDGKGRIVARCVIYNKAKQYGTDKEFRLAERQYAVDGESLYKRLLIAKLVEGGLIDAYKPAGAGCHEPRSWVDVNGNPLSETKFCIECELESGDTLSYQDSFKYYNPEKKKAYNYSASGAYASLESTDGVYDRDEGENWDSWNEEYTNEDLYMVFSDGDEYWTTYGTREFYFRYVARLDEWHHEDDVECCAQCGECVLKADSWYDVELDKHFCSESCRGEAIKEAEEE